MINSDTYYVLQEFEERSKLYI